MTDIPDAVVEKAADALRSVERNNHDGLSNPDDILPDLSGLDSHVGARAVLAAVWTDLPAARPVVDRDALAEVFSRHRYALGHEGILSDGEYAWLECTCGFKQNLALPQDDIRIAEAAWERHLADAVLTVVQDAADVRRAVAEDAWDEGASEGLRTPPHLAYALRNPYRAARIAREAAQR